MRLGYVPALDGIRALAVLAVMAYHRGNLPYVKMGSLGVHVFFVLSGMLITSLLLAEFQRSGQIDLRSFYVRRTLRLFPPLLLVLLAVTLYAVAFSARRDEVLLEVLAAGTYTYNVGVSDGWVTGIMLPHLWTLAMEAQFYLLWPILLAWMLHRRNGVLLATVSIAAVTALSAGYKLCCVTGPDGYGPLANIEPLGLGCLLAIWLHQGRLVASRTLAIVLSSLSALFLAVVAVYSSLNVYPDSPPDFVPFTNIGGMTLTAIGSAAIIAIVLLWPRSWLTAALSAPTLVFIGRISYELYLWHFPIYEVVGAARLPGTVALPLAIGLSFVVASGSYYAIDRPMSALRRRQRRPG